MTFSQDDPLIAPVDLEVERESLGYKIIVDEFIKCGNCGKKLLNINKVKEGNRKNYFIVHCPYCGDKSYKYTITGIVYAAAAEGLVMTNIDTDIPAENIFTNQIEVKHATRK